MNQKFFDLPEEKQQRIINSALTVFSKYDYKKASTDEIVRLAGISKGLLFHYFSDKKTLYLFLLQYSSDFLIKEMSAFHDYQENDFFQILVDAQMCKMKVLSVHPHLMVFLTKAYLEDSESVKNNAALNFSSIIEESSKRFLQRADTQKFQEGVAPKQVLDIILWMSDGYMRSRTPEQLSHLEALNDEYLAYLEVLRQHFYKPEYI